MSASGSPSAPSEASKISARGSDSGVGRAPPVASGALPGLGHLLQLRRDPIALMQRAHDECGEIGELRLARQPLVMLYGEQAQEAFFRAPDEQLDQAAAYPFMTPIFGNGVVFDASPEQRRQAMRNQSLRDQFMRGHAELIAREAERAIETWGCSGEIDLLEFFAELTIYTSSACLLGKEFRDELTSEYAALFQDLERGTDALAYVNPNLPLPTFWKRDRARARLGEMIGEIIDRREAEGRETKDLVHILTRLKNPDGSPRYTPHVITGMFVSMMFAGHHTTSGTAAWTLIELLRNPSLLEGVTAELDAIYGDGREVSYHALREIPELECAIKEALRLHPPLVILMRKVMSDFHYKGWTDHAGKTVAVSPAVSNRMPEHFPEPERFDPDRYKPGREEDKRSFGWIPFGAGRHRCVGAAFAMMQLKAIFSVLLRDFEFELAQPSESYRNDNSKLVIQLEHPCRVGYRRRELRATAVAGTRVMTAESSEASLVAVDLDLCQGHGVCVNEAPEIFELVKETNRVRLLQAQPATELLEKTRAAVRYCPTGALSLRSKRADPPDLIKE